MKTWFSKNLLKASTDKCRLVARSKVPVNIKDIRIFDIKAASESMVNILGIYVDNSLNFKYQVSQLC